jgi:hypothetical protein
LNENFGFNLERVVPLHISVFLNFGDVGDVGDVGGMVFQK